MKLEFKENLILISSNMSERLIDKERNADERAMKNDRTVFYASSPATE